MSLPSLSEMFVPDTTLADHYRTTYPLKSWSVAALSIAAGTAHAGCLTLVAWAVYAVPHGTVDHTRIIAIFVLIPLALGLKLLAYRACVSLGEQGCRDLRTELVRRLSFAEPQTVRLIGHARLRDAFGSDMQTISAAVWSLIMALQAWVIVLAATVLAFFFAFDAAFIVIQLHITVYFALIGMSDKLRRLTGMAHRRDDHLADYCDTLIDQPGDLRTTPEGTNAWWRRGMRRTLRRSDQIYALRESDEVMIQTYRMATGALVAGVIAFALPHFSSISAAFFMLTLFFSLFERLNTAELARPFVDSGNIAMDRVKHLLSSLPLTKSVTPHPGDQFSEIQFDAVQTGPADVLSGEAQVGPFSLSTKKGHIYFVSGLSGLQGRTFLKLICGLLPPASGQIRIDGIVSKPGNHRHLFAAVFSDYHLFTTPEDAPQTGEADPAWIRRLGPDGPANPDHPSAGAPLSAGQRKKLALAQAIAEGAPVLLLEDWTADQDAASRNRFFTEWLPLLRTQGFTVIATVQDENNRDDCDTFIRFRNAQICNVSSRDTEAA